MTLPQPPIGRRSNGLQSAEWGALVDLDPRLSEALLDSLAAVGVAAYVEPASGAVNSVGLPGALPKRPLDRLWVDPTRADEARAVVGAEVAELTALLAVPEPPAAATSPEDDPDEVWRQIVDAWTRENDDPVPPWPVSEDLDERAPARRQDPDPDRPHPRRRRTDKTDDDALPAWLEPEALEDDGHYVPPPPPPVPRVRRHTVGAVVAVIVGLVLTFAPELIGQVQSIALGIVGIALMLGGAGALVWHMRDAPPTDSGPDDGAVV